MPANTTESTKQSPAQIEFLARNVVLSRRLFLALVVFCAAMMLLGPTIAETMQMLLGCQAVNHCGMIGNAMVGKFAAFYRADSLIDVPFIFLQNFWWLVLAWAGLIAYIRLRRQTIVVTPYEALVDRVVTPYEARVDSAANRRPMKVSDMVIPLRVLAWISLLCLVLFCILFGTPILATVTASSILSQLGCEATANVFAGSSDCLNASGFWTPRLRGYIGLKGLLAPFLLIDNFLDVIIGWVIFNATLFIASYGMRPSD